MNESTNENTETTIASPIDKERAYTLTRNGREWPVTWQTKTKGKSIVKDEVLIAKLKLEVEALPKRTPERKAKQAELDLANDTVLSADEYPTIVLESLADCSAFFGGETPALNQPVSGSNPVLLSILQGEINLTAQKYWSEVEESIEKWLSAMEKQNLRTESISSVNAKMLKAREVLMALPKGSPERASAKVIFDELRTKYLQMSDVVEA